MGLSINLWSWFELFLFLVKVGFPFKKTKPSSNQNWEKLFWGVIERCTLICPYNSGQYLNIAFVSLVYIFWGIVLYNEYKVNSLHFTVICTYFIFKLFCHFESLCFPTKCMPWSTVAVAAVCHINPYRHITAMKANLYRQASLMMPWMFYRLLNVFCSDFIWKLYNEGTLFWILF